MKTSELIGPALDWTVAKCEGREILSFLGGGILVNGRYESGSEIPTELGFNYMWHPSTDWTQSGPIIEREKIWWSDNDDATSDQDIWWCLSTRDAITGEAQGLSEQVEGLGPTLLIAAMRCYVASKLGDEVEVPDELKE